MTTTYPPNNYPNTMTAAQSIESIGRSHNVMFDTLAIPCSTHDARRGEYCWGSTGSGVRAVCRSRLERGHRAADRVVKVWPEPPIAMHSYVSLPVPARRAAPARRTR